jgi:hypothetical protein
VARRKLPRIEQEKLGVLTIMDRALAARHGVPYVHLAAFAIDVDRVREAVEGYGDPRPFGWEVFLTEAYVIDRLKDEPAVLEDAVMSILDGEPSALGSQLAFAVWDAMERGALPRTLEPAFASWRARPKELTKAMAPLWSEEAHARRELAESALAVALEPPLAPPTREVLEAMARA